MKSTLKPNQVSVAQPLSQNGISHGKLRKTVTRSANGLITVDKILMANYAQL